MNQREKKPGAKNEYESDRKNFGAGKSGRKAATYHNSTSGRNIQESPSRSALLLAWKRPASEGRDLTTFWWNFRNVKIEESRNAGIWELRPKNRQLSWRFRNSSAIPLSFFARSRWNYDMRKLAAAAAVVIPKFQLSEIRFSEMYLNQREKKSAPKWK